MNTLRRSVNAQSKTRRRTNVGRKSLLKSRAVKEPRRLQLEPSRNFFEIFERDIHPAKLNEAKISAVDSAVMRKRFLRHPERLSRIPDCGA
jgi:hypothetical protein